MIVTSVEIHAPNEEWLEHFLKWLENQIKESFNDQDQFAMLQVESRPTGKYIVVNVHSLDAR